MSVDHTFAHSNILAVRIDQRYLEDVSLGELERPGFQLNPLPRLGLDGVDAFVVVVVVHREVGGQQSALSARDRIPTLGWKENHNNHRLTPISYIRNTTHRAGEPYKDDTLFACSLPKCLFIYPFVCLSGGLLIKFPFNTCPLTALLAFFISLILFVCLSFADTETNPPSTLRFHGIMKQPFPALVRIVSEQQKRLRGAAGKGGGSQMRREEAFLCWRTGTKRGQDRITIASIFLASPGLFLSLVTTSQPTR